MYGRMVSKSLQATVLCYSYRKGASDYLKKWLFTLNPLQLPLI